MAENTKSHTKIVGVLDVMTYPDVIHQVSHDGCTAKNDGARDALHQSDLR